MNSDSKQVPAMDEANFPILENKTVGRVEEKHVWLIPISQSPRSDSPTGFIGPKTEGQSYWDSLPDTFRDLAEIDAVPGEQPLFISLTLNLF